MTKCVEQFLDDYYDVIDPVGVAERLMENRRVEDQRRDLCLHVAGHLFTYNREQFWEILHCLPLDVETEMRERSNCLNVKARAVPPCAGEAEMCITRKVSSGRRSALKKTCYQYVVLLDGPSTQPL